MRGKKAATEEVASECDFEFNPRTCVGIHEEGAIFSVVIGELKANRQGRAYLARPQSEKE